MKLMVFNIIIAGQRKWIDKDYTSSSNSSKISASHMQSILEQLKSNCNRSSTMENYLSIWRKFNSFLIILEVKPATWEERVSLYCGYLVDRGSQLSMIRSYVSAIKCILVNDGYEWEDGKLFLNAIIRGCKIKNDQLKTRLPIRKGLLKLILFKVQRIFNSADGKNCQPYLEKMYLALFAIAYYGLFRVGELTSGTHPVKAKDVHVGRNKNKLLFVLYSSKTHGKESQPQEIKISALQNYNSLNDSKQRIQKFKFFCPFKITRDYRCECMRFPC